MRAMVQDTYGEAEDVLRLAEIDRPEVGPGDVLVQVRAAGVDRGVWHLTTGLPYPIRLAGYGVRTPKRRVPGGDVAGIVESVGAEVQAFRPGDEVFGIASGSFADHACASAAKLAPKPVNLTFEQAAALPVSGLTALQAVRDKGRVADGQHVLVVGASGGVGTFAVQIAKALGAEVTGVCSTGKVDLVRSIGADHVVDYRHDEIASGDRRYDVVIDIGGHRSLSELRHALTPKGILVIAGGETDGRWLGGSDRQLRALALSPFVGQQLRTFVCSENAADLVVLKDLVESGQVVPVLERTYRLDEAVAAIRHVQDGHARGKVVISAA